MYCCTGAQTGCVHHNLAKQARDEMCNSGYCPAVSRQRSQRDFCFRSQSGHLHLCSESGLENNICHPPLKNMSVDLGAAKIFQQWSARQQMVSAFCRFLFVFTWHAASVIAQSSELARAREVVKESSLWRVDRICLTTGCSLTTQSMF